MALDFASHVLCVSSIPWQLVGELSPRSPEFSPGSIHVGFVVDKVALVQVFFSEVFGFPLSVSFHRRSRYLCVIWGMNSMPVNGSSSETQISPHKNQSVKHTILVASVLLQNFFHCSREEILSNFSRDTLRIILRNLTVPR
jgi:hypothetical protein